MQTFWVEDNKTRKGFHHDGTLASAVKVAQDWCFSEDDRVTVFLCGVAKVAHVEKEQALLTKEGCALLVN